jgi:hypothetical protein
MEEPQYASDIYDHLFAEIRKDGTYGEGVIDLTRHNQEVCLCDLVRSND